MIFEWLPGLDENTNSRETNPPARGETAFSTLTIFSGETNPAATGRKLGSDLSHLSHFSHDN